MHRYFGEQDAYSLFNNIGYIVCMISSAFFFKMKCNATGLWSKYAIHYATRFNRIVGKVVEFALITVESVLVARMIDIALASFNKPFGNMVGTGVNYFGGLFGVLPFWFVLCIVFMINPLKQIDIATIGLPIYLFFVKFACFFNGCCWGIPWEYGPYNYHYDHPGNQVPVQLIEAFFAMMLFIFLLWYRKKAKPGTMYPMYLILYSATRFFSEFFKDDYENVLGPLKMYHILCLVGIVIGFVLLLIVKTFGDKIQAIFEKPHKKLDLKISEYEAAHKEEWERQAREKARKKEEKNKAKEKEKQNKKLYAKSRKL